MNRTHPRQHPTGLKHLFSFFVLFWLLPLSAALAAENSALEIHDDGVFQELDHNTLWRMERSKKLKTSSEVQQYLKILNTGAYSDWRLPTKRELYELDTIFDLKRNGEVRIQLEGGYWLTDGNGNISAGAWEIGDGCGPERTFFTRKKGYVRAVRP
ncbi:MAG: hypothetical protein WBB19_01930 [Desulforhopalus sp.]